MSSMPRLSSALVLGLVFALAGLFEAAYPRAVSAQEELFVADSATHSITVYSRTASGNAVPIRTLVGPSTGLNVPVAVIVDRVNDELFVSNANNSITVYPRTASGDAAPIRMIAGGATGLNGPEGLVVDALHDQLFVANFNASSITVYSRTATGNVAPVRTVSGILTGVDGPVGLALDLANDELYVVNNNTNSVVVLERTATGNEFAKRGIFGAVTGLVSPFAVAVDTVNGEVVVSNFHGHSVTVYGRTASGNSPPIRALTGPATHLHHPVGVVVDTAANELVVGSYDNAVTVYSRTASGNTAPLRTLEGASTGLSAVFFLAVTHDFGLDELVVADQSGQAIKVYERTASGSASPIRKLSGPASGVSNPTAAVVDLVNDELLVLSLGKIQAYPRTAVGNMPPLRTLTGPAVTFGSALGFALDTVHDELVVTDSFGDSIMVYPRTANGNVSHIRRLGGALTGLATPAHVVIDNAHDELIVANLKNGVNTVTVYSRTAAGDTPPIRTLAGPATALVGPSHLILDAVHDELIVANYRSDSVTVYPRGAGGNTAPLRTLSGAATGLNRPFDLALDLVNDELMALNQSDPDGSITVYNRTADGNADPIRTLPGTAAGLNNPLGFAVTAQECVPGAQAIDLMTTGPGGPTGVGGGAAAVATNPVTIRYAVQGCGNHEMFLIVLAPGAAVYYNGSALAALPDPLSSMTPFVTGGPLATNGIHTLFSGSLPPGSYDFFLICDKANNGHLDVTSPPLCLNGAFDHLPLTVQ
jgi:6-phosphogluconolactonase (cycloisomerase 2 family)